MRARCNRVRFGVNFKAHKVCSISQLLYFCNIQNLHFHRYGAAVAAVADVADAIAVCLQHFLYIALLAHSLIRCNAAELTDKMCTADWCVCVCALFPYSHSLELRVHLPQRYYKPVQPARVDISFILLDNCDKYVSAEQKHANQTWKTQIRSEHIDNALHCIAHTVLLLLLPLLSFYMIVCI